MRPLEIAILALNLVAIAGPLIAFRPNARGWAYVPAVNVGLVILHLVVERYRWQMVPAYALTGVVFLLTLPRLRRPAPPAAPGRVRALLVGAVGVPAVVVAAAAPVLFPVLRFPTPTGPYKVGTVSYDLLDPSRAETYTPAPDDKREIMVQVWYPASPAPGARTGPWLDRLDLTGPIIARYINLPSFALDHAGLVRTNSYPDAPVSEGQARYPVVVYSHGWNGFRAVNTNQMEALASHGYIAVSIDHTYGAMFTVFPDGRVALNNPDALPDNAPPDEYQKDSETVEATYAADIRFVLDQLEQWNAGSGDGRFAGRLDMTRVGLFGHSTGGGAVVLACSLDPRCTAGLGMDAWVVPIPASVVPGPIAQSFMFMRSEVWATDKNKARLDVLYNVLTGSAYRLTIKGTGHYDFTLLPLLTPLAPYLKLKGPLEGNRAIQIVTDYMLAFFDKHLKGLAEPLLDGPSPAYPEVIFDSRQP